MKTAAASVASFFWQFTGVLNQDVPLDKYGKPTEFARYVDYFIERKKHFQGEMSVPLKKMMVTTYLEALEAREETRAHIRRSSIRAGVLARRSKSLSGIDLTFASSAGSREDTAKLHDEPEYTVRDIVEAVLVDHGMPLLDHIIDSIFRRGDFAGSHESHPKRIEISAGASSVPQEFLDDWAAVLERYLANCYDNDGGLATNCSLQDLRIVSSRMIRPDPGSTWQGRVADALEAITDTTSDWLKLAYKARGAAIMELIREIRALPRLIPSAAFLVANSALFVWIEARAISEIATLWGALAFVASLIVALWLTDAVTYAVHLDRDGWGNSTVARAFQDHHDVPDEVGLWTVRRSVGTTGMIILTPMTLLALIQPHFTLAAGTALFLMGILFATQTHRWAHAPPDHIPGWVAALQKIHMMIPAHAHAVHHDNLDRSWGIFNGWSNRILDSLGYHERYTRLRIRLFGDVRPLWESQLKERARLASQDRPADDTPEIVRIAGRAG